MILNNIFTEQRRKQVKAKKAKEENQRLLRQQLECRTRPSIKHSKSHGSLDGKLC